MNTDYLVVGAGLTGATIAQRLSVTGKRVTVIDKRSHIGGNAYDVADGNDILIHPYGPHIFHTNSQMVWDYLSKFTAWHRYEHRVLASIDNDLVPVPFNLNSLYATHSAKKAYILERLLLEHYGSGCNVPVLKLLKSDNRQLRKLGDYVYRKIFLGYTLKMWGMTPEALSPQVTARVPVRVSFDDRYFLDRYQGVPRDGYTAMINRMLDHPNIIVMTNTDFSDIDAGCVSKHTFYTGPIDKYYGCVFGELQYRSIQFVHAQHNSARYQTTGTINYPNEHDYTRITEFKYLTGQISNKTSVCVEYPSSTGDPYYPIPCDESKVLYNQYAALAEKEKNVTFAGRLGNYRYYNMDQAVAAALHKSGMFTFV